MKNYFLIPLIFTSCIQMESESDSTQLPFSAYIKTPVKEVRYDRLGISADSLYLFVEYFEGKEVCIWMDKKIWKKYSNFEWVPELGVNSPIHIICDINSFDSIGLSIDNQPPIYFKSPIASNIILLNYSDYVLNIEFADKYPIYY